MTDDTSEKIVDAALEVFSEEGFGGARVARIAEKAGVNKALLFYYYRSKEKLYSAVMERVISRVFTPLIEFINSVESPQAFFEGFPALHIRTIVKNQRMMRLGIGHFIVRPTGISREAANILKKHFEPIKGPFFYKVDGWIKADLIRAEDPYHFIINVISLNAFCYLARPFFETISDISYDQDPEFMEKRIRSVVNTLKGGMLK